MCRLRRKSSDRYCSHTCKLLFIRVRRQRETASQSQEYRSLDHNYFAQVTTCLCKGHMEAPAAVTCLRKVHMKAEAAPASWRRACMETEASVAFSPAPKEALLLDWTAAIQEVCLRQWPSGSTYASGEAKSRSGEQRSSMLTSLTSAAPTY